MKDNYHHGNLRNALIEAGLKIINESGEDSLSLRKVAAACNVSHAAPYAHFEDKESLIEAIKQTVTDGFIRELDKAVNKPGRKSAEEALLAMGEKYILFFRKHPDYFHFLFQRENIKIHTDMSKDYPGDYEPFRMFKKLVRDYLEERGIKLPVKEQEKVLIQTWGIVQGLSSVASMNGVNTSISWSTIAKKCIRP